MWLLFTFLANAAFAAAKSHQSGGLAHIVIIDSQHPTPPAVSKLLHRLGLYEDHPDVHHVFNNSAFTGFAASMESHYLDLLANMSDISLIERSIGINTSAPTKRATSADGSRPNAPWGLQRISTAFFQGVDTHTMDYNYSFANDALGQGTDIYILDTGIWTEHEGFEGRAKMLWSLDDTLTDTDGHGTHVSGTAGAIDFGVASKANIFGVRVLDNKGGGSTATVIAGIDQVIQQHDSRKQNDPNFLGSVMSISLAALGTVPSLDQAIAAAVQAGVHTCVAAGNSNHDACSESPASSGGQGGPAITVGSIGISGQRSTFSNYGSCVDVYAPGEDILSAGLNDPTLLVFLSGTSQAAPHVTGMVAYAMANSTLAQNPRLMKQWVSSTALPWLDGSVLANNGADGSIAEGMLGFTKQSTSSQDWDFIAVDAGPQGGPPSKRQVFGSAAEHVTAEVETNRTVNAFLSKLRAWFGRRFGRERSRADCGSDFI